MRFFQSFRRNLFSQHLDLESLGQWRELVLSNILYAITVLGAIVAVPSTLFALIEGRWSVALVDAVALCWVAGLWRSRSLAFRTRAWSVCALLYLLGLSLLFTVGMASQIYLMSFPVMVALLLGLRPSMQALALNAITLLVVGYWSDADIYIAGFESQPFIKWIVITLNFIFINAVLTLSVAVLLHGLEKSLERKRESEELYRTTFEKAPVGVSLLDLDGHWLQANRKLCEITGYTQDEMRSLTYQAITHPDDLAVEGVTTRELISGKIESREIEKRYVRKDGTSVWVHLHSSLVRDALGEAKYFVAVASDITENKKAAETINVLAYYDQLTGLPNRTLLLDRLKQTMAVSARDGNYGALLFIDLDNFKTLNDTLGHSVGDLLLRQVGQRLRTCIREGDSVARFGGDEFVAMLTGLGTVEADAAAIAEAVADKVIATLNKNYLLDEVSHHSTPSIGVTLFKGQQVAVEELMKQVDLAMYRAKSAGRNVIRFFDPAMQAVVTERAALESDLRQAIKENQFELHYQAQVVGDGGVTGAEVLLRWHHPQRGMVPPAEFIPTAEETGLILPMGHWVLHAACTQLALWARRPEMAHLTVAVNVSARQFRQSDFVDQVLAVLKNTGADSRRLKLELTESLLITNVDNVIEKMFALKAKGVGFSLDDFGTGFSSLSYLKRLPLDQLKIDQSFVRDVLTDPNDAAIARTIIALGQSLGLDVIAEGVEIAAQRDFLRDAGCHAYQGYFFSRPLPIAGFEALARRAGPTQN
jgi:diguanylate cyclase (GGDEF)-like protein/PAS domain S-box-containing protein